MNYLSICSGIEAASVAWHPLGWKPVGFAEIESFPSAVLAHHYPTVPNLGDMTKHSTWKINGTVELLVGGTPCQAFSVAGLRKGLADPRGNLTLTFLAIAEQFRPRWILWENVPGVLSDKTGAFGSLLGGLAQLGYGWAYRVLDAQYFGVAQRRRRVFVVGHLGDWHRAAAVLFERESLRRDTPPRREPGQRAAPTISSRSQGGGGLGTDAELDGALLPSTVGALPDGAHMGGGSTVRTHTLAESLPAVADCLQERDSKGSDSNTKGGHLIPTRQGGFFDDANHTAAFAENSRSELRLEGGDGQRTGALTSGGGKPGQGVPMVVHALRGEGHDASEDGTGRGTPLVAVAHVDTVPTIRSGAPGKGPGHGARSGDSKDELIVPVAFDPQGAGKQTNLVASTEGTGALGTSKVPAVAFDPGQSGNPKATHQFTVEGTRPVIKARPHAVAFERRMVRTTGGQPSEELQPTLRADTNTGDGAPCVATPMAVRRLTPRECERLQGFPDDYTLIPHRGGRPAADGPRYKALGNSMAVPVMRWIGNRIALVDAIAVDRTEEVA